jgi:hypothetical protein
VFIQAARTNEFHRIVLEELASSSGASGVGLGADEPEKRSVAIDGLPDMSLDAFIHELRAENKCLSAGVHELTEETSVLADANRSSDDQLDIQEFQNAVEKVRINADRFTRETEPKLATNAMSLLDMSPEIEQFSMGITRFSEHVSQMQHFSSTIEQMHMISQDLDQVSIESSRVNEQVSRLLQSKWAFEPQDDFVGEFML